MFAIIFDAFTVVIVSWFTITQIMIPLWNNQKMFPSFRKSTTKVEEELAEVNTEIETAELENTIKEKKQALKNIRSKKQ